MNDQTQGPPESDKSPPAANETKAKADKPREKKPEFFGPRGWRAVLLPYIIFLGGLSLASYVESARVHTALKESANRSQGIMLGIMQSVQSEPKVYEELRELGWPSTEKQDPRQETEESYFEDLTLVALGEHYNFNDLQDRSEMAASILDDDELTTKIGELSARFSAANQVAIPSLSDWKAANDFVLQLLQHEDNHETRAIIAEYFLKDQQWAEAEGREPRQVTNRWFPPDKSWYPATYTIVIALTTLVVLLSFPKYLRDPFRISPLAIGVGVIGIFLWLGLWWLDKQYLHLGQMFSKGAREAFNPLEELKDNPTWMWAFFGIRLWGLVIIIPIVEEFFLRGWLMRYIDSPDWDEEPIGKLTRLSLIGVVVYAVFSHPAEPLAAVAWFGMITAMFVMTRSIWDCVVAHLVTNLLLGIYVIATGTWELW
jgi:CAAX prenyl protease-like protein